MKKISLPLAGILLLTLNLVCVMAQEGRPFIIKIRTSSFADDTKAYLVYQANGAKYIDSAVVAKRQLLFTGKLRKPLRATIVMDTKQIGLPMILKSDPTQMDYLQLMIFPGSSTGAASGSIAGTVFDKPGLNYDFAQVSARLKNVYDRWAAVSRLLVKEADTSKVKILRHQYDSLRTARIPILYQFVHDYPDSYAGLLAWEEYKGLLSAGDGSFPDTANFTRVRQLFETLSLRIRQSEDAMEARRFFANVGGLVAGAMAPEFSQPDPNGRIVKLSDFRGSYVLLDFWASWCGPCRDNNPDLKKLYAEFRSRNFTILGISLDAKDGREKWVKAIKDDGLTWPQVSDLQHWDNAVVKLYSVPAVPHNLLIGPDGKIIANHSSTESLRSVLEKLLPAAR